MKKRLFLAALLFTTSSICCPAANEGAPDNKPNALETERKYQVVVSSLPLEAVVMNNGRIDNIARRIHAVGRSLARAY